MRHAVIALPLLLLSVGAAAQGPVANAPLPHARDQHPRALPRQAQRPDLPGQSGDAIIPPELTDPRISDQIGRVAGVVARSMMNLPVGELEAAIEGRPPTPSDRARRVRDNVADPYLEQRIAAEAAASGRTMQAATRALANSLPAIMKSLEGARAEIERTLGNMPDPTYPRR